VKDETNLDLLHRAFAPAAPVLTGVTAQLDILTVQKAVVQVELSRLVAACARARSVPAAVTQMIDRCYWLLRVLNIALARIDETNEEARDLTERALVGLEPARDDLHTTRAELASGNLYNRLGH
jgi:hypothetical protein